MDIEKDIKEVINAVAAEMKAEIVDLSYKKEGRKKVLRILADTAGGITVDECALINSKIGEILDESGLSEDDFVLEVCSPGLDRALVTDKDFARTLGKSIQVNSFGPIEGVNVFTGKLLGFTKDTVVVENESGISTQIPRDKIAKAKLYIKL